MSVKVKVERNEACTLCELHRSSTHVCIYGRTGDNFTFKPLRILGEQPQYTIMMVGEAPGRNESRTGKPFMGESGKLINRIMEELNPDFKHEVYITNVARCRPPENRPPTKEEVAICSGAYLGNELDLVNPKVLIALGRVAADYFEMPQLVKRGELCTMKVANTGKSILGMWTYHPSFVLQTGAYARKMFKLHLLGAWHASIL